MKKLRNKIFYTVFSILSLSALFFIMIFNLQHYNEQYNDIKRSLNFKGLAERNYPSNDGAIPPEHNNRNIRFMDANAVAIILDENDNIIEMINHSNDDIDVTEWTEVYAQYGGDESWAI